MSSSKVGDKKACCRANTHDHMLTFWLISKASKFPKSQFALASMRSVLTVQSFGMKSVLGTFEHPSQRSDQALDRYILSPTSLKSRKKYESSLFEYPHYLTLTLIKYTRNNDST